MRHRTFTLLALLVLLAPACIWAQTVGTVMPTPKQTFWDASGNPCAACLLYTFVTGTTTPLATYSDAAMTTANANPVVLDSAGRATVYLSGVTYKFVLKTAAGATLWTQDTVAAVPPITTPSEHAGICDGRLSLSSTLPVTTADVTAATVIYFHRYGGSTCSLYNGSQWISIILPESPLQASLTADAADRNTDLFIGYFAGGSNASLVRVAWTNDTTRATALVLQDGVLVLNGNRGYRYLGTFRTTATIAQTEDSMAKRFLWNYYHRVPRVLQAVDVTDSWAYTTATWRQARATATNQVGVVVGVSEDPIVLNVVAFAANTSAAVTLFSSIGIDSTTATTIDVLGRTGQTAVANVPITLRPTLNTYPAAGYHYYAWLEYSTATGTTTWYGDDSGLSQSGMFGRIIG